jgi:hypothetical protein
VPKLADTVSTKGVEIETSTREEGAKALSPQVQSETADTVGSEVADAVAKIFEETRIFETRLNELHRLFLEVEKVGRSADELFAPLRSFHLRLSRLAESFVQMRSFQVQVMQMAQTFEPMKVLHDQLAQVSDSFQEHLARLARALDPAKKFRDRILWLADTFNQAEKLQAGFSELASTFGGPGDDTPAGSTSETGPAAAARQL